MAGIVTMKDNVRLFVGAKGTALTKATKLGNIVSIGDISATTDEIDTTTIDSLAKTFEAGFTDNGSIEITQNITNYEYATMKEYSDNSENLVFGLSAFNKKGVQVLGLTGEGIVLSINLTGISVGGLLQVVTSIRISGAIDSTFVDPIGPMIGIPVTGITVTGLGGVSTITELGGELKCVAAIEPTDASNKAVTWKVNNTSTATINAAGVLTAVANGTVTVTATARDGSGVSGTMEVTITGQADG